MHAPSALIRERFFDVRKRLFEVREWFFEALRFAHALKKRPPTFRDFDFFLNIPPILKIEVGFFSGKKKVFRRFSKIVNIFFA